MLVQVTSFTLAGSAADTALYAAAAAAASGAATAAFFSCALALVSWKARSGGKLSSSESTRLAACAWC